MAFCALNLHQLSIQIFKDGVALPLDDLTFTFSNPATGFTCVVRDSRHTVLPLIKVSCLPVVPNPDASLLHVTFIWGSVRVFLVGVVFPDLQPDSFIFKGRFNAVRNIVIDAADDTNATDVPDTRVAVDPEPPPVPPEDGDTGTGTGQTT